jgi:tetratricopeptide (TPR) repeat protein
LEYFEEAFQTDPSDPQALEGFVYCKLRARADGGFLSAVRQSLESAIARCREYAEVGIDVPRVHYQIGFFSLLLGRPDDALSAYAKAVETTDSPHPVEERLKRIDRLKRALSHAPSEIGWVRRFLRAAVVAKSWQLQHDAEDHKKQRETEVADLEKQLHELGKGNGDRHLLPERPEGCFAQKVPVTFSTAAANQRGRRRDTARRLGRAYR